MRTHLVAPVLALALLVAGAAHARTTAETTAQGTSGGTSGSTPPADGDVHGGAAHEPTRAQARTLERKAGIADPNAAAQNRELDRIGKKLLRETPRNPPNADPSTGGTLVPPR